MTTSLFLVQLINGLQYGLLLFLIASGLTLVFGVMGILNLAHGSMYMVGAYLVWYFVEHTGSFGLSALLSAVIALLIGIFVERTLIRRLYRRNHLDQVLLTIGMIFVFNALQSLLWGNDPLGVPVPEMLSGAIPMTDVLEYPVYRLFVAVLCIAVAVVMYLMINKTRLGMLIRAGESNREMEECLGINIHQLYTVVFAIGVMLATLAGVAAAPMASIVPGMGEHILITCFVVVVIGGMGSIKGAFVAALLVGMVDTFASVMVPQLSSMMIYLLMAFILLLKPQGLFSS